MTKTKLNLTENEMNSQIHGKNIMVNVLKSKTCSYVIRWLLKITYSVGTAHLI